jgi:hypothetical protein
MSMSSQRRKYDGYVPDGMPRVRWQRALVEVVGPVPEHARRSIVLTGLVRR